MAYASSPILQAVAAVPSLAEMEAVLVDLLADMVTLRYVLVACMTVSPEDDMSVANVDVRAVVRLGLDSSVFGRVAHAPDQFWTSAALILLIRSVYTVEVSLLVTHILNV